MKIQFLRNLILQLILLQYVSSLSLKFFYPSFFFNFHYIFFLFFLVSFSITPVNKRTHKHMHTHWSIHRISLSLWQSIHIFICLNFYLYYLLAFQFFLSIFLCDFRCACVWAEKGKKREKKENRVGRNIAYILCKILFDLSSIYIQLFKKSIFRRQIFLYLFSWFPVAFYLFILDSLFLSESFPLI